VSGGSEAVEASLKLARQYFVETGQTAAAPKLIARRQSYHGNTLGALATGGNAVAAGSRLPAAADRGHTISRPATNTVTAARPTRAPEAYGLPRRRRAGRRQFRRLGPRDA
jgi:adenosylmethionine-8-amino-7-oxononanoate aminotransferase